MSPTRANDASPSTLSQTLVQDTPEAWSGTMRPPRCQLPWLPHACPPPTSLPSRMTRETHPNRKPTAAGGGVAMAAPAPNPPMPPPKEKPPAPDGSTPGVAGVPAEGRASGMGTTARVCLLYSLHQGHRTGVEGPNPGAALCMAAVRAPAGASRPGAAVVAFIACLV